MTRPAILAKIKAMLAMTVANGCTEAEAMTALAKAREWMTEYEVTETDLTFGGEEAQIHTEPRDDRDDIRGRLACAIGAFCGCKAFKNGIERIAFVGLHADTVFAHWLLDTLAEYVARECRNWLDANPSPYRVRRLETRGFLWGCADRIVQRLYELAALRPPGTDIILKKNALIEAAMTRYGIKLHEPFRLRKVDAAADAAGVRAADRATFDKPVTDRDKPLAIT